MLSTFGIKTWGEGYTSFWHNTPSPFLYIEGGGSNGREIFPMSIMVVLLAFRRLRCIPGGYRLVNTCITL